MPVYKCVLTSLSAFSARTLSKDKCADVVSMLSVLQNRNQPKLSNTTDLTLTKDSSNTSNVRTSDTQPNGTNSVSAALVTPGTSTPSKGYTLAPSLSFTMNSLQHVTPVGRTTNDTSPEVGVTKPVFKMKPREFPTFNGRRRDWPRFKARWKNIVEKQGYSNFVLADQLLISTENGFAHSRIQAIQIVDESSYTVMWNRLEEHYEDQGAILASIYQDLDNMKSVRNDSAKAIVDFADELESIHENLFHLSPEHPQKVDVNRVDKLVHLIPENLQSLWNRHYFELDSCAKESPYSEFVRFMCRERAVRLRFIDIPGEKQKPNKIGNYSGETSTPSRTCWLDDSHQDHWTRHCEIWRALTPRERRQICLEKKKCLACLDPYIQGHTCSIPRQIFDKIMCKNERCYVKHRNDIACHASESKQTDVVEMQSSFIQSQAYTARYNVQIPCRQHTIPLFADDGSDSSFIYEKCARDNGFKEVGKKTLSIKTLNGSKRVQSRLYEVPLVTKDSIETIVCHSVPQPLTGEGISVNMDKMKALFPLYKGIENLQRDTKPAEILLGLDYFKLHPQHRVCSNGNISIMSGPLGDTLVGSSEESNYSIVSSYYISKEQDSQWQKFIAGEEIGTQVTPRCGACKCGKCPQVGSTYSFNEEQELRLIREGLSFDEGKKHWVAKYPWKRHPGDLPDNKYLAVATLKNTERTLRRDSEWYRVYSEQIKEMEARGSCRKLTSTELNEWVDPVFYICHLAVVNHKSVTTPVRIVFNSSQACNGISLNSSLAKGPDSYMNCMLDILIRWREYSGVILGDISKMFHAIVITEPDQHMHRFLWRENSQEEPDTYVMTALNMGDICSQNIAMESIFLTGERVKEQFPEVNEILKSSSYVDDIVHSTLNNPRHVANEVHGVLKEHGFNVKQWWINGETHSRNAHQLQEDILPPDAEFDKTTFKGEDDKVKVLGLNWSPIEDTILYSAELNFSPRVKGCRTEPDIKEDNFHNKIPKVLSRRTVLEQFGKIFDPIGLIGPHILNAKILLRQTWEENLQWDDPLPEKLYNKWIQWFKSCFELDSISFNRCTRPVDVEEETPWLVIFSDGSQTASGYTAYVRWKTGPAVYTSHLLLAKNRIAPVKVVSVPRLELTGALLGARGRKLIQEACRYEFARVVHLVDSETVLSQINSIASRFKQYEGTRIGEIQRTCEGDMSSWYWIPTEENISDWNTRGKPPVELGPGSLWQDGPSFLCKPFDEWPVKSVEQIRVNQSIEVTVCAAESESSSMNIVNFERVSNWDTLVRSIAVVLSCIRAKSFDINKHAGISPTVLREVELIIIKEIQSGVKNIQVQYRSLGVVLTQEGIWAVGARGNLSYQDLPVIIPHKHPAALMVMERAHKKARHSGVYSTLAMCRQEFYIAQGSKMAKKVRNRCTECRLLDKQTLTQKMGMVPLVSLKPAPAFNVVQIDLFGPWIARGEVQKRTSGKCWGVLFVCLASRAVHIEIIAGYSTDDFLMGLQRFGALRGWPHKLSSDPGSQLVAAEKELQNAWKDINFKTVEKECTNHKTNWQFSPADSPHYQGVTESLIKTVKRAIKVMYSHSVRLSWQEYVTMGYQVADMVNSRPLGLIGEVDDSLSVLTPNSLLLGRNSSDNPGCWPEGHNIPRLSEVNRIVGRFWSKWMELCRPALLTEKKWNTDVRNLEVDDIVLVLDNDPISRQYKLAKVCEVKTGKDGKVRSAQVEYRKFKTNEIGTLKYSGSSPIKVTRCCQRLVLIVPVEELLVHKNDY